MSEKFLCSKQEECPVVLGACERKVMAESKLRLLEDKYDRMAKHANKMYTLGKRMLAAQKVYFADRTRENLVKSKVIEKAFADEITDVTEEMAKKGGEA